MLFFCILGKSQVMYSYQMIMMKLYFSSSAGER